MGDMRAKLIRTIEPPENRAWYFRKYEYECIVCGAHYIRGQCNSRISPYCADCHRKIERQKNKEYAKKKTQKEINRVLKEIQCELQRLADDEWNKQVGSSKGLEDAIDVIESHISRKEQA